MSSVALANWHAYCVITYELICSTLCILCIMFCVFMFVFSCVWFLCFMFVRYCDQLSGK